MESTITGPAKLLAVLPHLLGYEPHDGLLLVSIEAGQVQSIQVGPVASVAAVTQAVVVDYDGPDLLTPSQSSAELCRALSDGQVGLLDHLAVRQGRWRSLLCDDFSCCPETGHPMDQAVQAVEFIAAGSAPFASREEMASSIAAPSPELDSQFQSEFLAMRDTQREHDRTAVAGRLADLLSAADPWDQNAVIYVAAALHEIRLRDFVLAMAEHQPARRAQLADQFCRAARMTPDDWAAPLLTVLAGIVWQDGRAALAGVALDRALGADPAYSLARLLNRAIRAGVPPTAWRATLARIGPDGALRGAA